MLPIDLKKLSRLARRWGASVVAGAAMTVSQAAEPAAVPATSPTEERRFPVAIDATKEEFSLIVVPDTQRYSAYFPEIFRAQFQWIRDAVQPLNVKFVVHEGDVVENGTDPEWELADSMFRLLDDAVPYLVVPGNHDLDREAIKAGIRATTRFNAIFPPRRFAGRLSYGGHMGVTSDNSFGYFTAGGQHFMVLGLEYAPSDQTLDWANELAGNSENKLIVVTHCYMYDDNTRVGEGDDSNPHKNNAKWNDGEQIWEKFVRKQTNVAMVLSGHIKRTGAGRLISKTDSGAPVLQMLANYQNLDHGGEGWLRILKFSPREQRLDVYTYSPWLRQFREERTQRFSIDVPWMFPAAGARADEGKKATSDK